ncbi:hypothetical protein MPC4_150103 [Methylocella tundrae]|uniref:Uncharacterized protein n=1 Tax=Methylocella tundrae TaxID=227605 RepID=A0A8B6M2R6_METTU|nr:hypothetical protein MPC4_150103 [Methylocella tundrae]
MPMLFIEAAEAPVCHFPEQRDAPQASWSKCRAAQILQKFAVNECLTHCIDLMGVDRND